MTGSHLDSFPVHYETAVSWGHLDSFQHVNNTIYFRYFEDARIQYFEQIGLTQHMARTGIGPILARTSCVFRQALGYPERILVGARIEDIGTDRFTMMYRIVSKKTGKIAAEGDGRIIIYDYNQQQKAALPPTIRARIDALETGEPHPD